MATPSHDDILTVRELLRVKDARYQRGIAWSRHHTDSFINDCLIGDTPIPRMAMLCTNGRNNPKPEDMGIMDGKQRTNAIRQHYNYLASMGDDEAKMDLQCKKVPISIYRGTHRDGLTWMDNELRRVSHTAGDYIYMHRDTDDIAHMTYDIYTATVDTLNRYLDRAVSVGEHEIRSNDDYLPYIACAVLDRLDIPYVSTNIHRPGPDRSGKLWMDYGDIKDITYDRQVVQDMIHEINSISTPIYMGRFLTYVTGNTIPAAEGKCMAIIARPSSPRRGEPCGNNARYHNSHTGNACCGQHKTPNARFI